MVLFAVAVRHLGHRAACGLRESAGGDWCGRCRAWRVGNVEGGTIPYRPEALVTRQEKFENRRTEDPEAKCYLPGVPRGTYMPFPFQIVQGTSKIFIAYEFASANRVIHNGPGPGEPGGHVDGAVRWALGW